MWLGGTDGAGSYGGRGVRQRRRRSPDEPVDGAKDVDDLALQYRRGQIENTAPRVQDQVDLELQQRQVMPDSLAQAPLNPISIDGFPHHLSDRETNPRHAGGGVSEGTAIGTGGRSKSEEEAHLLRKLLAASDVDALIIAVPAKSKVGWGGRRHTLLPKLLGE